MPVLQINSIQLDAGRTGPGAAQTAAQTQDLITHLEQATR
jgi:hypothetical protein